MANLKTQLEEVIKKFNAKEHSLTTVQLLKLHILSIKLDANIKIALKKRALSLQIGSKGEDKPGIWEKTKFTCSICGEPQYKTPSGLTCKNPGHGGADSNEEEE